MKKSLPFVAALLLMLPLAAFAQAPVIDGIPNFHQVTDRIYRGGQPQSGAWAELASLGVKTVVDLRRPIEHSVPEESLAVVAAGMRYLNFPMNGFDTPTAAQLTTPLSWLDANEKVFVHCKQGMDRTGTVIAIYRISRQGWENQKALAEAKGCGMHWFESGMKRFIAGYQTEPGKQNPATAPIEVASADSISRGASVR
jgi:protein tyrosine phosphatase (PTP) superfamily phosphohydrolase (DUF442 family)